MAENGWLYGVGQAGRAITDLDARAATAAARQRLADEALRDRIGAGVSSAASSMADSLSRGYHGQPATDVSVGADPFPNPLQIGPSPGRNPAPLTNEFPDAFPLPPVARRLAAAVASPPPGAVAASPDRPVPNPWNTFDTPDNPGSIRYIDRHGAGGDAELAGLRARAMATTAAPPDFSRYTPQAPAPANSYDRPNGGATSRFQLNPLLAFSARQIEQDEVVRADREARYGNMRGDALIGQKQELEGEQLRAQMGDPLGLEMKRKVADLEMRKMFGAEQAKADIQSASRRGERDEYTDAMTGYQAKAEQIIDQIQRSTLSPDEKLKAAQGVQTRLAAIERTMREAYGVKLPAD